MNLKTTLVLVIVAVVVGVLVALNPPLLRWLDLTPAAPDQQGAGTQAVLENELKADKISRVELVRDGQNVTLERGTSGAWSLPGNWPARDKETNDLVNRLASLRSGFCPEPLTGDTPDLTRFGLDKPALTVTVKAGDKDYRLTFGQPAEKSEETNRYSVPTYLRLGEKNGDHFDDKPEVIRLEPGLMAQLDQPADHFRQWRLFPTERVAQKGFGPTETMEDRALAEAVTVEDEKPENSYTLTHAGDDWQLTSPYRDQPISFKVDAILKTLPDVWVSSFVADPKKDVTGEYGLKEPAAQAVTVRRPGGQTVTLELGKVAPSPGKKPPPFPEPGVPPRPPEEYRYARVRGSNQVFVVRTDKLKQDVLIPFADLRESGVVAFNPADARRVEIVRQKRLSLWNLPVGGTEKLVFTYDTKDHKWLLLEPLAADAENTRVDDLLRELSGMRVDAKEDVSYQDDPKYGLGISADHIAVELEEETKTEPKTKRTRSFTVVLGNRAEGQDKFFVRVDNVRGGTQTARVSRIKSRLPETEQLAVNEFRGRRLLAFDTLDLDTLEVQRKGEKVTLKKTPTGWKLTSPVEADADSGKAGMLAGQLGGMQVDEYVAKTDGTEADWAKYGFPDKDRTALVTATLTKGGTKKLIVGKAVEGKPEYYATAADKATDKADVVTVAKTLVDALNQESLAYRPLAFPPIPTTEIAQVQVQMDKQKPYLLKAGESKPPPPPPLPPEPATWQIAEPFHATPLLTVVQPLVEAAAAPKAEKYVAHEASDADLKTKYGLDEPHLRVTVTPSKKETKERTLLVGGVADKDAGTRYARLADQKAVFVVGKEYLKDVEHAAEDLLDPHVLVLTPADPIERLESNVGGKALKLERQGDTWQVTESPAGKFAADQQAVSTALVAWFNLGARRFVAYGTDVDLAKYGLKEPETTVSLKQKKEEKPHQIKLGKAAEGEGGGVYAQVDDVPGVLVLDTQTAQRLRQSYLDYVPHKVFADDLHDADVFKLLVKQGASEVWLEKKDNSWVMTKPQELKGDDPTMARLLEQLVPLRATRVAAYAADKVPEETLKEYGLTPAAGEVKVRYGSGEGKLLELQLGKAADDKTGDRYAVLAGKPAVLVLPGDVLRDLLAGPLYFRDRVVAAPIRDEVDKIELLRGGTKAVFARKEGTWQMVEPLVQEVDHDELQEFVDALSKLRADELVADKPADLKEYGLDQSAARWKLQVAGKDVLTLLIGKAGPDKQRNGKKEGARVFAKVEGSDLVFLLDPKLTVRATGRFRNRQIWAGLVPDQVHTLRFQSPFAPFVLEKKGDHWEVAGKPGPVNAKAVQETLDVLANLRAERFVAEKGADLAAYGLDKPRLKLEIQTAKGKRELDIGNLEGLSRKYYARVASDPDAEVFLLSEADGTKIVRDLTAFQQAPGRPPFEPPPGP